MRNEGSGLRVAPSFFLRDGAGWGRGMKRRKEKMIPTVII
jgi:hypothetical protein